MRVFIFVVAALHAAFMLGELFPLSSPFLLQKLGGKLPRGLGTELPKDSTAVLPGTKRGPRVNTSSSPQSYATRESITRFSHADYCGRLGPKSRTGT
jgi:hypothetical protein